MRKLLSLLPSWLPLVLAAALVGGTFLLKSAWQNEAINGQAAKDATKVIEQQHTDHQTSADQMQKRDAKINSRAAEVAPVQRRIELAPDTPDCPDVICVDAADGVRRLLEGYRAGRSPAGRLPPD